MIFMTANDFNRNEESGFDLIGDIHGYADELIQLLEMMGYHQLDGVYRHSTKRVIFLGDFVDRGPLQRKVIDVVRPMIEQGYALAVMGNHEFNAIAFNTPDGEGGYLRPHNEKNIRQHEAFLSAYPDAKERTDVINWFKTLPLWLDLDSIRVIHACWDTRWIKRISEHYDQNQLSDQLLLAACEKDSWEFEAVETLLKGKEVPLPDGRFFEDKDGNRRHNIRIRWWDNVATYREAFIGPASASTHIPDDPIEGDHLIDYRHDMPPVFLGHYWLEPPMEPLAANVVCLDYSVAKPGGRLVAYRWDEESEIDAGNYVYIDRLD